MGSEAEALKAAFSTNTNWAEWAAFAVFVGLLGDIAVILIFDLFDKDKSWWEIILAGIASAVIAFGVWGESHFGHRATNASGRIQAILERQTEDAKRGVIKAQTALEQEHVARLRLEAKLADRQVTPSQKDILVRWLQQYKDVPLKTTTMIDVCAYGKDPEAVSLVHQLASIFADSGCKTTSEDIIVLPRVSIGTWVVPIGIVVEYDSSDAMWYVIANGVANALRRVDLLVGSRPCTASVQHRPI